MIVSEINIKLTVLGYWGVGKTSTVNSYLDQEVPEIYIPTIGSSIKRKEYILKDKHIRINIWDIGGQRSFNPLNPVFFSNLDAAFLVFDLSNPKETLLELQQTYLKNLIEKSPECLIYLVGNKSDLIKPEDSQILLNSIRSSKINEFPIVFISAKTQNNVSAAFESIIFKFLQKVERESSSLQLNGITNEYLKLVNKSVEDFDNLLINLENIDSASLQKKLTPTIIRKAVKEVNKDILPARKITSIKEYKKSSMNLDLIKNNIVDTFRNNLSMIEDVILDLKNTPIKSLINTIDKSIEDLYYIKKDFELKLDSILELSSKEDSEMDIAYKNRNKR